MFTAVSLLAPLPAALAGGYQGPVYSGGSVSNPPRSYSLGSSGYGGRGSGYMGSENCSGAITTTFTWVPASGQTATSDPPPQSVIVLESGTASAGGSNRIPAGSPANPVSGGCDDGMGASQNPMTQTTNQYSGPPPSSITVGSGQCGSTRYTTQSGSASVTLTCSPSANASGNNGYSASVSYSASASPVTIQLSGPVQDSSGNQDILVGQNCGASLAGIPSSCTVSGYQWSVSGTTFQSWSVSSDQTTTTYVDGPGPLSNPTASWYWNDLQQANETVSCTATVTPPARQGSPFTVTATKQVTVMVPNWQATGTGGNMQVSGAPGGDWVLQASPLPSSDETGGMVWNATVLPPPGTTFGAGSLTLVQLIIPNISFTGYNMFGILSSYTWTQNGQEGLDTGYPYPSQSTGTSVYAAQDSPGIDLTRYGALTATFADQFEDYLMYAAPGSSQLVPVGHFV